MTVGEYVRAMRLKKGLTQKELAEECGMFDSAIRRIELGGQKPKFETLEKIAKALDISVYEFLECEKNRPISKFEEREDSELTIHISKNLRRLTESYNKLNASGKQEAIKRVEELTEIPKYTTPDKE